MTINIRDIQHYMYCPRRFALLGVNDDWQENAYVVLANIMHENVNSGRHKISSKSKYEISNIYLYDDDTDIFGVADCIEFKPSETGIYLETLKGSFDISIIEYKPTQPKAKGFYDTDAIQAFGYKLCADYIWKCSSKAYIYYINTKNRIELPFETEYEKYYSILKRYIREMNYILEKNIIPEKKKNQKCSGCSMKDICMPKSTAVDIKKMITESLDE